MCKENCKNCNTSSEYLFTESFTFEEPKIEFTKVRDVKSPNRGTQFSAGIDFYIPENLKGTKIYAIEMNDKLFYHTERIIELDENVDTFYLDPGERCLIPSGIKTILPEGTALIMFNKSGVSSKLGLDVLACVIDEDYRGEIHINLVNTGNMPVCLTRGMKIVQAILLPVFYTQVVELTNKEYNEHELNDTDRGNGGFGSTGV